MGAGPAPLLRASRGLASDGERGGEAPSTWRGSPDLGPGQGRGIGVGLVPLLWQRGADEVPEGTSPLQPERLLWETKTNTPLKPPSVSCRRFSL